MKGDSLKIFRIINQYSNLKRKYEEIKDNEEKREHSCFFAITSAIHSLLAVGLGIAGAWLLTTTFDSLLFIFILVIGIILLLGAVGLLLWALIRLIFQFGLNRKWWSWFSLIIFLSAIAGMIFSVFYFLN